MSFFLFRILPIFALAAFGLGLFFLARGFLRGDRRSRFWGIGFTAFCTVLASVILLSAFSQI